MLLNLSFHSINGARDVRQFPQSWSPIHVYTQLSFTKQLAHATIVPIYQNTLLLITLSRCIQHSSSLSSPSQVPRSCPRRLHPRPATLSNTSRYSSFSLGRTDQTNLTCFRCRPVTFTASCNEEPHLMTFPRVMMLRTWYPVLGEISSH